MRTFFFTAICFLYSIQLLLAQNESASLSVQSPDGKTVKLIWSLNNRGSTITGFDIKRKEELGDWVKLNSGPILPGISTKDNFADVESDKTEASRIKAKLFKLIADNKLKETGHEGYLRKLDSNDKSIVDGAIMMAHDYDIALISGFAYVDHSVTNKTDYQYGLFVQGTNILLAKADWNYGEIPDLNVVTEVTAKGTIKTKGIHLIWNVDIAKMRAANVAGFNIYRQGIRLNTEPVTCTNNNDPSEFTWYDKSANTENISKYSISAESIFGIEGIIKSYIYDPIGHPDVYSIAEAKEITSIGYYFKEGMGIKWYFPADYEKFIKGFYIEKNILPDGYKKVSALLAPSARSFTDISSTSVSSYIGVRVITVYKDKTEAIGPGRLYTYFPVRDPPLPLGLKAKSVIENKKILIKLSWEPLLNGDTITDYYHVYAEDKLNDRFDLVKDKQPIRRNTYTYSPDAGSTPATRFFITAVSRTNEESVASDTVSVQLPSVALPAPVIKRVYTNDEKAIIDWEYNDIALLKGFRLYQGKELIAGEAILKSDQREFKTQALKEGNTYEFTLVAVSENNTESPVSLPASLTINAEKKKR